MKYGSVSSYIYFEKKIQENINTNENHFNLYPLLLLENIYISLEQLTIISSLITALKGDHNNQGRQTEWKLTSATRLFDQEKRDFRDF